MAKLGASTDTGASARTTPINADSPEGKQGVQGRPGDDDENPLRKSQQINYSGGVEILAPIETVGTSEGSSRQVQHTITFEVVNTKEEETKVLIDKESYSNS